MPVSFHAKDEKFAAATGANVNVSPGQAQFDTAPSATMDLVVTANEGDEDPRNFEIGDTYDVTWGGFDGGGTIEDAVVVRTDTAPGGGGIIVLEGIDENGELVQIIWTPGFDLEQWYADNYNPAAEPQFYVEDTDANYTHEYICFASETRISTAIGAVTAGELWPGDRLSTLDNGVQEIRWTGRRNVVGRGANAPVLFEAGALGNVAPLRLSQQHRVMIASARAELLFGAAEVLVPAKALVNGVDIRLAPCPRITYVHLLLPGHQILLAEGALCESLYPGDIARHRADLSAIPAASDQQTARPVLSFAEAIALTGVRPPPMPRRKPAPVRERRGCLTAI
ncbi:Hint domain-containing protein [Alisedimentitalea sp. MJ-SS2]|uniref:Hint domain-containing protein n=1 Tax=Aliisedimentitalea sp. MJ-SS2 TaxID=3049795 RepID=UPI002908ADD2|nr:Hint domain-containing protein [Alisedimentitalea sp. MJ-SS2]MDU8927772.1 Hint domain-containing protein [Alisedimentitalea sp. MJ-SS2]